MTSPERRACVRWPDLLEEQNGVLARGQALRSGLSEDAWQWRLDSKKWQRVLPGVAVAHSGPMSARQQAWAALLYAGRGAALSGDVALVQQGLSIAGSRAVDIAVPVGRRVVPQALGAAAQDAAVALRVHEVAQLERIVHPVLAPRTVRPAPALLHAVAWAATDRAAEWRLAAGVQQRLVLPAQLRTELAAMPRLRRRALIADVLDDVELGAHARSELEFLTLLRPNGLPMPDQLQRPVRAGGMRYLDAYWERHRVRVEVDGAHHRSVGQWDLDVLRANGLAVAHRDDRLLLLRYSRGNLRHDEVAVVAQLRLALLP